MQQFILTASGTMNRFKPELQTPIDGKLQGLEFRLQAGRSQNENCCHQWG